MIERLLPRSFDGSYHGAKSALWLLGFLSAIKLAMGLNCIVNGRSVLSTADGVPLASYPAAAAQTAVALFAIWGWGLVLLALLALLALVRYRSMAPLAFALLLIEQLGRKAILQIRPIVRSDGAPASWINTALLVLLVLGLLLSLRRPRLPDELRSPAV